MKQYTIIALLLIGLVSSALQCDKECIDLPDQILDDSRQWLPLKGFTQLQFADQAGVVKSFDLLVVDTVETRLSCSGNSFKEESIGVRLLFDTAGKNFISFNLNQKNFLCLNAISDVSTDIFVCDVFKKAGTIGNVLKRLNFNYGGTTYSEAILLRSTLVTPTIDSVLLVRNVGIAGFKFGGVGYSLR